MVCHGVEVAIVVGGGNFFKGASLVQAGMDHSRADYIGTLGAAMNTLTLQDFIEQVRVPARVQSVIAMARVAGPYILLHAICHLEKGRVVTFGVGADMLYFSADAISVQWVLETHCGEFLVAKNGIDGVYDSDPRMNPETRKLDLVTYSDALIRGLRVVDSTALTLYHDNGFKTRTFGTSEPSNVTTASLDERIGILVMAGN